jgi:hypothetical protein
MVNYCPDADSEDHGRRDDGKHSGMGSSDRKYEIFDISGLSPSICLVGDHFRSSSLKKASNAYIERIVPIVQSLLAPKLVCNSQKRRRPPALYQNKNKPSENCTNKQPCIIPPLHNIPSCLELTDSDSDGLII